MVTTTTDRSAAVQARMAMDGFDALIVCDPSDLAYVSGFRPTPYERLIAVVVPQEGPLRAVVPSLEADAASSALPADTELHVWRDEEGPRGALERSLSEVDGRVGIEKSYLTVAYFDLASSCLPGASFDDCGPLLSRLRAVKDDAELDLLRRAAGVVDTAVTRLATEELRPGRTEAELAAAAAVFLREAGGEDLAFPPAILTGPKSALPHGHPDATQIADGDLVIVDIGVSVGGYCADITRTFVAGAEPDSRQRELFKVVREAEAAGVRAAVAGALCKDVDRAARAVIEAAGLGEYFVHRTGHGLGLDVHEPPYLTSASEEPLEEGMVVTVEPGVYVEGSGGVRIEDDVVVRGGEAEVLTQAPIRLESGERQERSGR
jgi:Xaa-Pro dipeptidase